MIAFFLSLPLTERVIVDATELVKEVAELFHLIVGMNGTGFLQDPLAVCDGEHHVGRETNLWGLQSARRVVVGLRGVRSACR